MTPGMIRPPGGAPGAVPAEVVSGVRALRDDLAGLSSRVDDLARAAGIQEAGMTWLGVFHTYLAVFVVAFAVTLLATPLMRRLALKHGLIDRPGEARKVHRAPVAYLGGAAVFLGIMGGILYSYLASWYPALMHFHRLKDSVEGLVPISVLLGVLIITGVGLLDDVVKISPRVKIGGQLFAAAALAADSVGVKLAAGVLRPVGAMVGNESLTYAFNLLGQNITVDIIYWTGTAIIAVFVLGACNASNLIDGLDGLCTGVTAIAAAGLLVVALTLAAADDGPRDAQRVILCMALLGACLGFLPHNFNPATIFLGDSGSLLLGYMTIVIVLTLGDQGQTYLVLAGLMIYSIPIIDTVLAIIRRKLAGRRMSDPDDGHLHHMLKRSLGVRGAVFALYAIGAGFAALGVAVSLSRARVVYAIALVFAAFVVVTAVKIARRRHAEEVVAAGASADAGPARSDSGRAAS